MSMQEYQSVLDVSDTLCKTCDGCGQVANSDNQEPWTAWESLPPGSNLAVVMELVKPITCPTCMGKGQKVKTPDDTPAGKHFADIHLKPDGQVVSTCSCGWLGSIYEGISAVLYSSIEALKHLERYNHTTDPPADRAPGAPGEERKTVCLVGRRKDWRLLRQAEVAETLAGNIVLTVGCIGPDGPQVMHTDEMVRACQETHYAKIRLADEVLHVHAGHTGEDTARDIAYARDLGKPVHEMVFDPPAPPSADEGSFEAWARGNEDVIYESDYQLARRAWNAATRAAQQQHASETAAYDSEILRLQDQEAHFARKAHSYEIANMGLDQRVEKIHDAGRTMASYIYASFNPGEIPQMVRDAMTVIERHERALATQPTPTETQAAADADCYTLPNGECVAPKCRLHGDQEPT